MIENTEHCSFDDETVVDIAADIVQNEHESALLSVPGKVVLKTLAEASIGDEDTQHASLRPSNEMGTRDEARTFST